MLEVKQAVARAFQYAKELLSDQQPTNLQLEEVEYSNDDKWRITLGFDRLGAMSVRPERVFKKFTINADTGNLESMKMP